jgi:hypothetical protein
MSGQVEWNIGDTIAHIPFYAWKRYIDGAKPSDLPGVRYGEIIGKGSQYYGNNRIYPVYTVRYSDGDIEECDGINFANPECA